MSHREVVDVWRHYCTQGSRQKFSYTWCKMNKCQLAKKLHMVLINLHLVLAILFGLQCVLKVWIYTWWYGSGTSLHIVVHVVPFINVNLHLVLAPSVLYSGENPDCTDGIVVSSMILLLISKLCEINECLLHNFLGLVEWYLTVVIHSIIATCKMKCNSQTERSLRLHLYPHLRSWWTVTTGCETTFTPIVDDGAEDMGEQGEGGV